MTRRKLSALAEPHGLAVHHRPRGRARRRRLRDLLRRPGDEPPRARGARGDRGRPPRLLREADHRGPRLGARARAARRRGRRSSTASCRTSCSSPGMRTLKRVLDSGELGRVLSRARGVRLLGLPRSRAGAAAAVVELPRAGRRRDRARHVRPLAATCSTTSSARSSGVYALGATHLPLRHDEKRRAVRRHRRGRRVRDLRARGRRGRAAQLVVVRARRPRRAVRAAGRRHRGHRRRRTARVPDPARGATRRARSGTPTWPTRSTTARPGSRSPPQSADNAFKLQWERFLRACRARRAVPLGLPRRRARRPARGARPAVVARAPLGRGPQL